MSAKDVVVRNIGKKDIKNFDMTLPIISISDRYSQQAEIPNEAGRKVLHLEFFAGDYHDNLKECVGVQHADAIRAFMSELVGDRLEVLVNCGEGMFRSYSVCAAMYHQFEEVTMHSGTGQLDMFTFNGLMNIWEKQDEEAALAMQQIAV